jgi:uncharacterized protein
MSSSGDRGRIAWIDLTVPDAEAIRGFYNAVIGWTASEVDMGGYSDYCAHPAEGEAPVAGICHARGANARLPAQLLVYITVEDLDASAARCVELGGKILDGPRAAGGGRFCVIRDPAGAVAALSAAVPSRGAADL